MWYAGHALRRHGGATLGLLLASTVVCTRTSDPSAPPVSVSVPGEDSPPTLGLAPGRDRCSLGRALQACRAPAARPIRLLVDRYRPCRSPTSWIALNGHSQISRLLRVTFSPIEARRNEIRPSADYQSPACRGDPPSYPRHTATGRQQAVIEALIMASSTVPDRPNRRSYHG